MTAEGQKEGLLSVVRPGPAAAATFVQLHPVTASSALNTSTYYYAPSPGVFLNTPSLSEDNSFFNLELA